MSDTNEERALTVPEQEKIRESREAITVVKPESIEDNNLLEFDVDNPKLGSEMLKIYMGNITDKGMGFKIITRPELEKVLPPEYISYVCQNIGRFMVDSVKFLSSDDK